MRNFALKKLLAVIIVAVILGKTAVAQQGYTPYDELPAINKSYKPTYSDELPDWAKKLYQYPVNYNEVSKAFKAYTAKNKARSPIIRYYKLWGKAITPYVLADGTIKLPDIKTLYASLNTSQLSAKSALKTASAGNANWNMRGPFETFDVNQGTYNPSAVSCQANVYSFDVASSNTSVLYCGTETGFMNKTTDKGLNWAQIGANYNFGGGITAVAIHPTNQNIVYVAGGNQMHKTTDGGATWTPLLPSGSLFYADRVKISPSDANKIIAVASNGIWVSTNGGTTWSNKWDKAAYDVDFKPNDNNIIYVLGRNSSGKYTLMMSTNGGTSFAVQSGFPTSIAENSGGLLGVTPANSNIIYALMLGANDTPYLYKGTLSGTKWTWKLVVKGKTTAFPMENWQGYWDLVFDVSPVNANILITGTGTCYKSTNGGTSFTAFAGYDGNFNIHVDYQDLKFLSNGETWLSDDGGMTLTTDNFTSLSNYWNRNKGLVGSEFWGYDQAWNEDICVAGRYHNGNTAIGENYDPKSLMLGGAEEATGWMLKGKSRYATFNDIGSCILPATASGLLTGGFSFTKYPNMDDYGGRRSNVVIHPNYFNVIYVGEGNNIWKSTDMGASFNALYTFPGRIRYFQISIKNPDVLYADIVGSGLYSTTNGGVSWTSKPTLTNGSNGTSDWNGNLFFVISPYNENTIYATCQNGDKVFNSTNGGTSWTNKTGTLTGEIKCLSIQPTQALTDLVYVITNPGGGLNAKVYYSQNGGSWIDYSTNYPAGFHANIALPFYRNGKLRVAGNAGVWESTLAEPDFKPIVNPWVQSATIGHLDTAYFDDHSILNHSGATWQWTITPEPAYISNANIRNPKVILGSKTTYSATLTLTQAGASYSKTISVTGGTSSFTYYKIKNRWTGEYMHIQNLNGKAEVSALGNPGWNSAQWEMENTGDGYVRFKNKQNNLYYMHCEHYLGYVEATLTGSGWGSAEWQLQDAGSGYKTITNRYTGDLINIENQLGYAEANTTAQTTWWSAQWALELVASAKSSIAGIGKFISEKQTLDIFPNPVGLDGLATIAMPASDNDEEFNYSIISLNGNVVESGKIEGGHDTHKLNMLKYTQGVYIVQLIDKIGIVYRLKIVKQ